MKKIPLVFIAIASLTFCTSALGQAGKFEIGVEAGPTVGALRGNAIVEMFNPAIRYSGGVSLQYNYSDFLSFRTNLAYERKAAGDKVKFIDPNRNTADGGKVFLYFDYLTVPLLARLNFGSDKIRYFVNGGPYVGYLLKQQVYEKPTAATGREAGGADYTSSYNNYDFGLTTGIGASMPLNDKLLISLEIRNNLGFTDLYKYTPGMGNAKINSTSLLLGLALPI